MYYTRNVSDIYIIIKLLCLHIYALYIDTLLAHKETILNIYSTF